ncbi:hypothetical protein C7B61_05115 [filamentous cyanobacterium CCP1]|nr:hypothetical protein C7B76_23840 [filamentous cyanobacterium CCP2]PSB67638.1 hypothetical protein C7B61_05115 [filamentous cyanobacterium CCP1]
MNQCPCCSAKLLRHVSRGRIYWFCPNCRQEMPLFGNENPKLNAQLPKKRELECLGLVCSLERRPATLKPLPSKSSRNLVEMV